MTILGYIPDENFLLIDRYTVPPDRMALLTLFAMMPTAYVP